MDMAVTSAPVSSATAGALTAASDPLNRLLNQSEFERRLESALRRNGNSEGNALFYLDLERFHRILDAWGEETGRNPLRRVVEIFCSKLSERDALAWIGEDDFALLAEDCSPARAVVVARELCRLLEQETFEWGGMAFRLGASAGLVLFDSSERQPAVTIARARQACLAARDAGGDGIQVASGSLKEFIAEVRDREWRERIRDVLV